MKIEIIHEGVGSLSRKVWSFILVVEEKYRPGIILDGYRNEWRKTRRSRKWNVEDGYCRTSFDRHSFPFSAKNLSYEEVPIPALVEAEMTTKLIEFVNGLEIREGFGA